MRYCGAISPRSLMNDCARPSATLWLLNASQVQEDDLAFFAAQLGASEAQRSSRFIRQERQRQFLLGRILLRIAVADLTGLSPNEIHVNERPGNSPRLIFLGRRPLLANFSLSHSREWVACATSAQATLGLDIEVIDPRRDIFGISKIAFQPSEHAWLKSQPKAERASAFYSLWSAREALFKLQCNLGREIDGLPLLGDKNATRFQSYGWRRYQRSTRNLSVEVFSDRPLSTLRQKILSGLTRADLENRAGEFPCALSESSACPSQIKQP
jgi:4'-phosphopantetheinyl transferase